MKYPRLQEISKSREMVDSFRGYNHNARISSGEFYEMHNMSGDRYPVMAPRSPRGIYASPESAQGLIAKDALCYVDGADFVIDDYHVTMGLSTEAKDCPKTLISMGAYVVILPDKKYINTQNLTEYGNIDAEKATSGTVSFTLCRVDGEDYTADYVQSTPPVEPENNAVWIDTSSQPNTLKQWAESSGMWVSIATTYVKIAATGIGAAFSQYDGVTISGLKDVELHEAATGQPIADTSELAALEGNAVLYQCADDYIVIVGMLGTSRSISDSIKISRKMPAMDYVTECGNRLFGCRYGLSNGGEVVNEIYASKLGDFKNWNCFMGISTDSYVASVGTDGPFTGAITHLGYPIFFKEGCFHKIYGSYPAAFQIQDTACRGVQRGCSRSLAIVGEILYYKARHAVCAFDGSLPTEISYALGDTLYKDAIAAAHGNKYYISMVSGSKNVLLVYDTELKMWFKEDDFRPAALCSCNDILYAIDSATGKIMELSGATDDLESDVEWSAETGDLGLSSPDTKYISRLVVRMVLAPGAQLRIEAQYDFDDIWETLCDINGISFRSFPVPVRPKRCDHLRLRFSGVGVCKIFSVTKTIEEGSDVQ
nr:MAG TPA: hypothetical protein [Caudoviricetes sp.]